MWMKIALNVVWEKKNVNLQNEQQKSDLLVFIKIQTQKKKKNKREKKLNGKRVN